MIYDFQLMSYFSIYRQPIALKIGQIEGVRARSSPDLGTLKVRSIG